MTTTTTNNSTDHALDQTEAILASLGELPQQLAANANNNDTERHSPTTQRSTRTIAKRAEFIATASLLLNLLFTLLLLTR